MSDSFAQQRSQCLSALRAAMPQSMMFTHIWSSCMSAPEFDFQLIDCDAGYVVAVVMFENDNNAHIFWPQRNGGRTPTIAIEGNGLEHLCECVAAAACCKLPSLEPDPIIA